MFAHVFIRRITAFHRFSDLFHPPALLSWLQNTFITLQWFVIFWSTFPFWSHSIHFPAVLVPSQPPLLGTRCVPTPHEVQLGHLQEPQHAEGAHDAAEAEEGEVAFVVLEGTSRIFIVTSWWFHDDLEVVSWWFNWIWCPNRHFFSQKHGASRDFTRKLCFFFRVGWYAMTNDQWGFSRIYLWKIWQFNVPKQGH